MDPLALGGEEGVGIASLRPSKRGGKGWFHRRPGDRRLRRIPSTEANSRLAQGPWGELVQRE